MAPISLDEYRKNQPPGRRRPKSSTAAFPPEQDPSAPAALEPTGEFQAVRSTAARLTTSAEDLLDEPAPVPATAVDPYMNALLERQAAADAEGQAQPVEHDPRVDTDLEAPPELDEQDRFFRELGHQPPQPLSSAPTALGSANLHATAASSPRARTRGKPAARARPATSDAARRTPVPRVTALAGAGVMLLLITGLAIANLGSSPTPHATLTSASTSTPHLNGFDTLASELEAIAVRANHLAGPRQPSTYRPRAHKPVRRRPRRQLHTVSAHVAASASGPTISYPSASASSAIRSSASATTPSGSAGIASGGSSGGTTPPAQHPTSPSPTSQPAFGANGTLGPGSSPNG